MIPKIDYNSWLVASSTAQIFGGHNPAEKYPALGNTRLKAGVLKSMKSEKFPFGNGIEGMIPVVTFS